MVCANLPRNSPFTESLTVARHLSNLTISPVHSNYSYMQPHYQIPSHAPYSEYVEEISYLSSPRPPGRDGAYWDNARNDAVRFLGNQASSCVMAIEAPHRTPSLSCPSAYGYGQQQSTQWQSNYQPGQFAQSVFQQTIAANPYPTPPPGISMTSSSLAFALQERPPIKPPVKPPQVVYEAQSSTKFFDEFLARKTKEMVSMSPETPHYVRVQPPMSSPDPLSVLTPKATVTPIKRKSTDDMESPSVKRIHSVSRPLTTIGERSLERNSIRTTLKSENTKEVPYVRVPNVPENWSTPSTKKKQVQEVKMDVDGSDDDLGGYGSPEGESSRRRSSSVTSFTDGIKSSAKRTGDRDDRGIISNLVQNRRCSRTSSAS
jgi:cohesin loading factor subunit SCC2